MVIVLHLGSDGLGVCWPYGYYVAQMDGLGVSWPYGYYVALGIGWSRCVLALWLLCCTWDRMI